jgi:long-chain-fatty-acid--CoA ligase ACSBG
MVDVIYPLGINACVYFAQPDALKGTLVNTLREARPTLFFGVPRVWEKMMERMKEVGASVTGLKRTLADWAKKVALEGNQNRQKGNSVPWGWTVANMLVLKKVHEALGLSRCMLSICGSAPVTAETLEFFSSVNIPILEVYGMSENTGPHTINRPRNGYWRSGSVGKPLEGMELKIDNPDENGDGEVLMRGRHVFMGYLELEEKTKEALDNDRWLHTGDIGRIDPDGFLYITGRIKELIITSGGENIPPVPIENVIKASVPFLSNVMLIGDKRKFLTCLITLKCVVDPDTGAPTDELLVEAKQALSALGVKYEKVSEVVAAKDEKVDKAIMDGIGVYNENHAVSRAQKVQKYYLLDTDFSVPGEELGPTLKLKRHTVVKKYAQQISSMYPE